MNARITPTRKLISVTMPNALAPQSWIAIIMSMVRKRALPLANLPSAMVTSPKKPMKSSTPERKPRNSLPTSVDESGLGSRTARPLFFGNRFGQLEQPRDTLRKARAIDLDFALLAELADFVH